MENIKNKWSKTKKIVIGLLSTLITSLVSYSGYIIISKSTQ